MKCLVIGCGRMGITHTANLLGLKKKNMEIFAVEPSLVSRIVFKTLFPSTKFVKSAKMTERKYDIAIIANPPENRGSLIALLRHSAEKIFVEKPVLSELTKFNDYRTGYVLQHHPVSIAGRKLLNNLQINTLHIKVESNVDFAKSTNWRGLLTNALAVEYLGHALTFALATFYNCFEKDLHDLEYVKVNHANPNCSIFEIAIGDTKVTVELLGNQPVRKARYLVDAKIGDEKISADLYNINRIKNDEESCIYSVSRDGANCAYYVRGFEFNNEMSALLYKSKDILTPNLINKIEKILL